MRPGDHQWTAEQIGWIRDHLHLSKAQMAVFLEWLFGFRCTAGMVKGVFANYRIHCGRTGRFEKGQRSFNKGKKGVCVSPATTFTKGHRPHNWQPVGVERDNEGILEIKIAEPHVWRSKHSLIWAEAHGPIPPGHVVIFADRDRRNFALDNLLLVSRGELAVMNKKRLIAAHSEATKVGKTIAQLAIACRSGSNNRLRGRRRAAP